MEGRRSPGSVSIDVEDLDGVVPVAQPVPGWDVGLHVAGGISRPGAPGVASDLAVLPAEPPVLPLVRAPSGAPTAPGASPLLRSATRPASPGTDEPSRIESPTCTGAGSPCATRGRSTGAETAAPGRAEFPPPGHQRGAGRGSRGHDRMASGAVATVVGRMTAPPPAGQANGERCGGPGAASRRVIRAG
jgi:hypothetical protein